MYCLLTCIIKPLKICLITVFENFINLYFLIRYNHLFDISNVIYLILNSIFLRRQIVIQTKIDSLYSVYDFKLLLNVLDVHEIGLLLFIVTII